MFNKHEEVPHLHVLLEMILFILLSMSTLWITTASSDQTDLVLLSIKSRVFFDNNDNYDGYENDNDKHNRTKVSISLSLHFVNYSCLVLLCGHLSQSQQQPQSKPIYSIDKP